MTRITSFGRKRTYVEAGFKSDPVEVEEPSTAVEDAVMVSKEDNSTIVPPKKKRKRTKKPKAHIGDSGTTRMLEESVECIAVADERDETHNISAVDENLKKAKRKSNQKNDKKAKAASWRAEQSELRRQQRIAERLSNTICFACRKKGHAAKDCPDSRVEDDTLEGEAGDKVVQVVGICYRCGSKRHTLSRCKKPTDLSNPLPFAACFVCSGKGHLASSCPQNKARGIYPNGGSCKLCGDTTHLAKNCELMKIDSNGNNRPMLFGPAIDNNVGADEDDFHIFKRRTAQIEKDEKKEEKAKRLIDMKAGAHSGVVKAFGKPAEASKKKIVYF